MPARIVLLVTTPRLPAGLMTAAAWDVVRGTPVFAGAESALTAALRASGVAVTLTGQPGDDLLVAGDAEWLAGPAGDQVLAREQGLRLAREAGLEAVDLVSGFSEPSGAGLRVAVAAV